MAKRSMEKTHDRALRMTLDLVLPAGCTEADELRAETWAVAEVHALMDQKRVKVEKLSCRPMWRQR